MTSPNSPTSTTSSTISTISPTSNAKFEHLTLDFWSQKEVAIELATNLKPDSDLYPLLPSGSLSLIFSEASKKPNLKNHYSEWATCVVNQDSYMYGNNLVVKSLLKVSSLSISTIKRLILVAMLRGCYLLKSKGRRV